MKRIFLIEPWGWYSYKMDMVEINKIQLPLELAAAQTVGKNTNIMGAFRGSKFLGISILKIVKKNVSEHFLDIVSEETFFEYLFEINSAEPT